ncbi:hypothetical protein [Thalassobius sp. Cn5-15]|jgi:hypothetical protein|uniref:hypothetical protein n=1 Tax=Thalassobius sp. Cn5-15 TaxID=2917763 RepID=UPI001EF3AD0A|nr:hypothetical protein [Thalassobius sp. Cn5-15]MCG7494590.1 hypothetical protein [Thalassobius sp. Cn5-15]
MKLTYHSHTVDSDACEVVRLVPVERIHVNVVQLAQLYHDLGRHCADRLVGRALADIAERVADCDMLLAQGNLAVVRANLRDISVVSMQVGLASLRVSVAQMETVLDQGDTVAAAALMARLHRLVAQGAAATEYAQASVNV